MARLEAVLVFIDLVTIVAGKILHFRLVHPLVTSVIDGTLTEDLFRFNRIIFFQVRAD
jgi:hypothetical protein